MFEDAYSPQVLIIPSGDLADPAVLWKSFLSADVLEDADKIQKEEEPGERG